MPKTAHLPDCAQIKRHWHDCDCGMPEHPIRPNRVLVRRVSSRFPEGKLKVIPKSQMREGERDLNESQLTSAIVAKRFRDIEHL